MTKALDSRTLSPVSANQAVAGASGSDVEIVYRVLDRWADDFNYVGLFTVAEDICAALRSRSRRR
jgi:hypothetical protein